MEVEATQDEQVEFDGHGKLLALLSSCFDAHRGLFWTEACHVDLIRFIARLL